MKKKSFNIINVSCTFPSKYGSVQETQRKGGSTLSFTLIKNTNTRFPICRAHKFTLAIRIWSGTEEYQFMLMLAGTLYPLLSLLYGAIIESFMMPIMDEKQQFKGFIYTKQSFLATKAADLSNEVNNLP